ncbi:MAG: hypothetical protein KKI02_07540, partial [Planctomycetes bacterium]|nr:hypothetical protein [Planctomycetota bacterium]
TAPGAEPSDAAPTAEMKPRLVAGANGALGFGLAAPLLLLMMAVFIVVMRRSFDTQQFSPEKPPPTAYLVLLLVMLLCLLLAIVAGLIGVFWGRAVLRRIRTVPGAWIGKGRARAGLICGLVTVLLPLTALGLNIVFWMARLGRG